MHSRLLLIVLAFICQVFFGGDVFASNARCLNGIRVPEQLRLKNTILLLSTLPADSLLKLNNEVKTSPPNPPQQLKLLLKQAKQDYNKGNYPNSLRNALIAEKLASAQKNNNGIADASNIIALVYMAQEQFKPAFPYLKKAALINKKIGNLNHLATNQINLSLYYANMHQLDSAIRYADSSLNLSIKIGAANLEAMSANHLGNNYFEKGEVDKAEKYFLRVLKNKCYQDDWENSFANTGLARLYLSAHNNAKAVQFGVEAFKAARKLGAKWDAQQSSQILYQAYHQAGDDAKAFEYLNLFKLYSDSLFNEKKEAEINFLLLKKKEAENRDLAHNNLINIQQHKITQMIVIIVSILAVALLALVTFLYKKFARSRKYNRALQLKLHDIERKSVLIDEQNLNLNQLNYTKDQLFSIIGHDLRSPFSSILSTLELFQSGDLEAEEVQEISGKFHEQVSVTAKMLDNLLLWGSSQLGGMKSHQQQIDLVEKTNEVLTVFKEVAGRKNITLSFNPISNSCVWADPDQVKIIIQNLLANAIKFTPFGGQVTISYQQTSNLLELAITDNGVGMSSAVLHQLLRYGGKRVSTYGTANEKGIGLGLLLVKEFAEQNNATIQVHSQENEGTTFFIGFQKMPANS